MNETATKFTPILFIAPVAALTYYLSHFQPMPAYHMAVAGALVLWSFVSVRNASIAFLIMMIIIDDYPRLYSEYMLSIMPFSSLYSLSVSGITVYLILAIYFTSLNIFLALDEGKLNLKISDIFSGMPPEIKILLCVGSLSALVGILNFLHGVRFYISDAGFFVNIFLGYLIIRNNYWRDGCLEKIYILIICAVLSKVVLVTLDALFFSKGLNLVTIKPGTDSYLVIVLILFGISEIMRRTASSIWVKLIPVGMIVLTISYYFLTASRGRMMIGVVAFLIFLFQVRSGRGVVMLFAMALALLGAQLLVPSEYMSYFAWKSGSFAASEAEGMSSLVRIVSLQNIVSQQLHTVYQLFTGTGLGGYFTSIYYPFPVDLTGGDAFPDEWIAADTFYKPHGSTLIILLKTGMIGFILIYGTFAVRTIKNVIFARNVFEKNSSVSIYTTIFITISPCILPFMVINFSSKLQLITGALIGLSFYSAKIIEYYNCYNKSDYINVNEVQSMHE